MNDRMKRLLPLLITLALLSLPSCHHRKSAEEGELVLQKIAQRGSVKDDSSAYYKQLPFEMEYDYDFTPEQRLRLKKEQLGILPPEDKLYDKLIIEAEALAVHLGNDSLLRAVRWNAFKKYAFVNDAEKSLGIFHREEPTLLARGDSARLKPYYASLTLLYERIYQADSAIYWHLKTRGMNLHHLNFWYGEMSDLQLKAGHSDQALLYTDSALNCRPLNIACNIVYTYPVRGKILKARGQTAEALALYATAMKEIEQRKKQITKAAASPINYGLSERALIYQYAELLYQNRRIPEAIGWLEKLLFVSKQDEHVFKGEADLINIKYRRGDYLFPQFLLAQCYHALGQNEKAIRYTHIGDSLQSNYAALLVQKQLLADKLESSNQYLAADLRAKELEARAARLTQYILWGAVGGLLAVIAAGALWWRSRRRRLRQLFDLLTTHHAAWLEIHEPYPLAPQPMSIDTAPLSPDSHPDAVEDPDTATSDLLRRVYCRVLQVMNEQKPFLDPNLDLTALARLTATNRTYLSTALNRQTGMNFNNWLAEYRVNYLIALGRLHPEKELTDLFIEAGFPSRTSFFRQFRTVTGLTPNQYKAQRREGEE